MSNVKTAISLQKSLFDQLETLARQMKVSRSRLLALALEEFIRRRENQKLLDQINEAYEDAPDTKEKTYILKMRRLHRELVEGDW
jgi:metal-responsive CopG/Arc/MetJ family transcriptional regulator